MHARAVLVVVGAMGCSGLPDLGGGDDDRDGAVEDGPDDPPDDGGPSIPPPPLPPLDASFDYQLGGAYPPPAGVEIVSRAGEESPAAGAYSICYLNGFQIHPDHAAAWLADHPALILRDSAGDPVIDPAWDEMLIDVGTPAKRAAVAAIVVPWIEACAAAGFDAIEIDNLDTFTRSGGRLTADDAVAMMQSYSDAAHARGLAAAQKNAIELVGRRSELRTDFVVTEECARYGECGAFAAAYDDHVLVIEYSQADFDTACEGWPELSIVLRDLHLATPASGAYRFDGC